MNRFEIAYQNRGDITTGQQRAIANFVNALGREKYQAVKMALDLSDVSITQLSKFEASRLIDGLAAEAGR